MKKMVLIVCILLMVILPGCAADEAVYIQNEDPITVLQEETVVITDSFHEAIENGNAYHVLQYMDLALGDVLDVQIVTGSMPVHFFMDFSVESEMSWDFYENVTINNTGTPANIVNLLRSSDQVSTVNVYSIVNPDVAEANIDTDNSSAMNIGYGIIGAGKDSGLQAHEREITLKPGTEYSMRFVAAAAGYITYHIEWFEE